MFKDFFRVLFDPAIPFLVNNLGKIMREMAFLVIVKILGKLQRPIFGKMAK
jgi:hypothetical protein